MKYLYPVLLIVSLSSCSAIPETEEQELYSYLQGSFTSERQSKNDSSYYDIILNISAIWPDRDGLWVYTEQALSNAPQNPYTQKIYNITRGKQGILVMRPYDLPHSEDYNGGWKEPSIFEVLAPQDLSPMTGCSIYFKKEDDKFVGKTKAKNCSSSLTASKYVINHFTVEEDRVVSWSRGFSADDEQVWGKAEGGYILEKVH